MSTPKIKVYKLVRGYSESSDNDIQGTVNDELLPIVDKSVFPTDAYVLKPVVQRKETLKSLGTFVSESIGPSGSQTQSGSNTNWIGDGSFLPIVKDDLGVVIPSSHYTINYILGTITFNITPYPLNGTVQYYLSGGTTNTTWYCVNYPIYNGLNQNFQERVFSQTNLYAKSEYVVDLTTGIFVFPIAVEAPYVEFYQSVATSVTFVSDHENWLTGHIRTNPDIFVGMEDYPGDDSVDEYGNPVHQGPIPKYVETGYTIHYRDGYVTFGAPIDTSLTVVRANYAYHQKIHNVTNQKMDLISSVGGYTFKAIEEKFYPDSHDRRWGTRDDVLMPINFYVNGRQIPTELTVTPYSELSVFLPDILLANQTLTEEVNVALKKFVQFKGINGQTSSIVLTGIGTITVRNDLNKLTIIDANSVTHLFTDLMQKITITNNGWAFDVIWNGNASTIVSNQIVYNGIVFTLKNFRSV